MSEIKDDVLAFPMPANEYAGHGPEWGMSLRDYFAAKAMQAYVTKIVTAADSAEFDKFVAQCSYETADAMLAAREKQS